MSAKHISAVIQTSMMNTPAVMVASGQFWRSHFGRCGRGTDAIVVSGLCVLLSNGSVMSTSPDGNTPPKRLLEHATGHAATRGALCRRPNPDVFAPSCSHAASAQLLFGGPAGSIAPTRVASQRQRSTNGVFKYDKVKRSWDRDKNPTLRSTRDSLIKRTGRWAAGR